MLGNKFGSFTAIEKLESNKFGSIYWLFQCECGNKVKYLGSSMKNRKHLHCGCKFKINKLVKRVCGICKKSYQINSSKGKSLSKFCSRVCADKARRERVEKVCLKCNATFEVQKSASNLYCSRECFNTRNIKDGKKYCPCCGVFKELKEFGKSSGYCKKCKTKQSREYILQKKFGLSESQYNIAVKSQSGKCLICKSETKLVIDHNHNTGEVRGLLCNSCNTGIGLLKDNPKILESAIEYLNKFGTYSQ